MIETITLSPGVTLRCFPDDRFKHGCLSLQLLRPMDRQEAALNALIPAVLLRGCSSAPDLRAITLRLDDLYGASAGALVRRVGDYQTTGIYCSFVEDRYALDGDAILSPMVDFLRQLLLEPVTENGVFRRDFVESEKKNLISTIESQLNDKRTYATSQLYEHMCREDSYGVPRLGTVEQVRAITPESAYAHYRKILLESPVELFYVGQAAPSQVARLLQPIFGNMDRRVQPLPAQTPFRSCGGGDFSQVLDVAQAKLCMGFSTTVTCRDPEFAAMQVCNTVLGAGMTSKLFMHIREKMSLCYYIGSSYTGSKGIVTVSAGIDQDKAPQVRQEILRQLEAICRGEITQQELEAAKQSLCSSLQGVHDSPGAIENYYFAAMLNGLGLTTQAYYDQVAAVTAEQVAQAAKTLALDTVFLLKGVQ